MINRTAEKVLSIIAAVFTFLGMGALVIFGIFVNMAKSDPELMNGFRTELLSDGTLTADEVEWFMGFFDLFASLVWLGVVAMFISLVLNIIGLVKMRKNAKAAGTLFIIAGLFNGILSLTAILLYIAGILCLTKKPPVEPLTKDEYVENQTNWMN